MKQDPRPFAFRCSFDLRLKLEALAEEEGRSASSVIRDLLQEALRLRDPEASANRLEQLENTLAELLLQHSQVVHAVSALGQQVRLSTEAVLRNLGEGNQEGLDQWLERRFPPLFAEAGR